MDRNVGVGLTKPHKPLKSKHSTYDGMRKVKLSAANDWKAEMEAKKAFLQELIKNADLDEAALEITKQVIAEGEDSLTPAQKFAFERNVLRKFVTQECWNGCDISWSEQYEALFNGGFCFPCSYGTTNYRDE